MEIYASARKRMAEGGNTNQWGNITPREELIDEDLEAGRSLVVCEGDVICGVFALFSGADPTYGYIEGRGWLNDRPYLTIHRIAGADGARGVFDAAMEYCKKRSDNIRIDTHRDNSPMLHLVRKHGFKECGIIYLANGSPRIAFQWTSAREAERKDTRDLTLEKAKELNKDMVTEDHLIIHSLNVCYAMGAMAEHFGEDKEHWMAVGYLHDYDYEKHPEEHLQYTEEPLLAAGVSPEDVRAIMSHGWSIINDVEPQTDMEKSLFAVDELTGIIQACARMRPEGISDLEVKSFMKKFKDKKFAAKCDRELIKKGCGLLGMEVSEVAAICIEGMRQHAAEIGLLGTAHADA